MGERRTDEQMHMELLELNGRESISLFNWERFGRTAYLEAVARGGEVDRLREDAARLDDLEAELIATQGSASPSQLAADPEGGIAIIHRADAVGGFTSIREAIDSMRAARRTQEETPRMISDSDRIRFWAKVDRSGNCWLWNAAKDKHGYGYVKISGKMVRAHRFAFWLSNQFWPNPCCLHKCDNPTCVRPSHLEEGTQAENLRQCMERGRWRKFPPIGPKLNENSVREIRRLAEQDLLQWEIAERFGVGRHMVGKILNGKRWGNVL